LIQPMSGRQFVLGRRAWRLVSSGPYGLLIVVLLLPTACFLLLPFFPSLFGQTTSGTDFLSSLRNAYQGYVVTALVNSVWIGLAASAGAILIAVGLAWLCERVRIVGSGVWRLGVWLLLLVPTYLTSLGFEDLLAPRGVIASLTGWYPSTLDHLLVGPGGVVVVLGLRGVAFAYFAVAGVVRSLGTDLGDAARVHGLSRWRTAVIQAGSITPALLAAFVLVFAETVSDFGVASTLAADAHFPIITYVIFTLTDAVPIDFPAAAMVSWSLVAVFVVVLVSQRRIIGNRGFAARVRGARPPAAHVGSSWGRHLATLGSAAFFVVALIGPVIGILVSSLLGGSASSGFAVAAGNSSTLTFAAYRQLFETPGMLDPIWLSLGLGVAGATVAVVIGLVINVWNQYRGGPRIAALIDIGLVSVIGLPSIVLAAGFVFFYDVPAVYNAVPIYDTQWLLLLGYIVGFTPIAVRMLHGPLTQAGRTLYDAARVHGWIAPQAWIRAVLPLIWRSLVSVWLFMVAVIMFELPLSEVLHASTGDPIAVAVAVKLKSQVATGTALTVVAIVAMVAVLGVVSGLQWAAGVLHRRRAARGQVVLDSLLAKGMS
jgi:iron(III) transport system permease protein